jgi:magnesium transporter
MDGQGAASSVIRVSVHTNGTVLQNDIPLEEINEVLGRPDELLWIDAFDPSPEDFELLRKEFGFHPLAMEDVARLQQRPKVDFYDNFILVIFYSLAVERTADRTIAPVQIGIFLGRNYVVTVHDRAIAALEETSDRWCRNVEQIGTRNIALLVYSILDAVVDAYFPVLDDISDRLDVLERRILDHTDVQAQQEIFRLKKELVAIRKIVAPERDVLNVLLRRDTPIFDANVVVYFQDVYDHILRVTDAVDAYRDLLSSALDFYLASASNRLNEVVKTLTALTIILMSMTLIASVYGMNFVHMPELRWHQGYLWALGLMAVIGASVAALFRRIDWL